jgi:hypothetical protein
LSPRLPYIAARKAAAMPEAKFEAQVAKIVKVAVDETEGNKTIVREARAEQQKEKRERRNVREKELASKQLALPDKKRCDPHCFGRFGPAASTPRRL